MIPNMFLPRRTRGAAWSRGLLCIPFPPAPGVVRGIDLASFLLSQAPPPILNIQLNTQVIEAEKGALFQRGHTQKRNKEIQWHHLPKFVFRVLA